MRNVLLVLLAAPLIGCGAAKSKAMEQALTKIWNEGDLTIIDDNYEPELAYEIKQFVQMNRELYPDIQVHIDEMIVKGPHFVTLWTVKGTHRDLNRPVSLSGVSVRKREGGKFVTETMYYDQKSIYDQLGFKVVPPEGVSPFKERTP